MGTTTLANRVILTGVVLASVTFTSESLAQQSTGATARPATAPAARPTTSARPTAAPATRPGPAATTARPATAPTTAASTTPASAATARAATPARAQPVAATAPPTAASQAPVATTPAAQTGEAQPTDATTPETPTTPPAPATPPPAAADWGQAPPPLRGYEQYSPYGTQANVGLAMVRVPLRCVDDSVGIRVAAETLGGIAAAVGSGFLGAYVFNSTRSNNGWGVVLGVVAYMTLTPLAVTSVAGHFRGNGRYWASLLGGLLLPIVGHVVGYELSHEPICTPAERERTSAPHPRRVMASHHDRASNGTRVVPWVAPSETNTGAITGLSVSF